MDRVAIYLRKSRADEELEKQVGHGETLAKHRKALLRYAKEHNHTITKIYEEIVSGESILHRPQMLQLLQDVEAGMYDAVLVMDFQRLGRGGMKDQGWILDTFKSSNTVIITPNKAYDLNNDADEQFGEFQAFMSRQELKMITKRMQGGRIRSLQEGNYIATSAPYGYEIEDLKHGRTLKENPEQSAIIRMIFDMYVNKDMGLEMISRELNSLGYKTQTGKPWYRSAITNIIKNPVYIGKLQWKKRDIRKSTTPGKKTDRTQRDKSEWIITDGKHEGIIDEATYYKAQEIIDAKYHAPYQVVNGPQNPLAGIIICGVCGNKMVRRPYTSGGAHIICTNPCGNKSSRFEHVEKKVLKALHDEILYRELNLKNNPKSKDDGIAIYEKQLEALEREIVTLDNQKLKLHDFLEQGVYNIETFIERSKNISDRIEAIKKNILTVKDRMEKENMKQDKSLALKQLKTAYNLYHKTKDVAKKNRLMKGILGEVKYLKRQDQKNEDFSIDLCPRL